LLRAGDFDMKTGICWCTNRFSQNGRTYLECCVQVLLWESLENAHSAEADTLATYEILTQLDRYPELDNDMKSLSEFTTENYWFCRNDCFYKDDEEILLF
jgi:DNA polymerase-3 subunit epsilon